MRLFFYGTLRPDAGTPMARWIAARLIRAETGQVPGRLFALPDPAGWYPALVPGPGPGPGSGHVRGIVCDVRLKAGELALLDRYEGREYRRRALPVRLDGGGRVCVQAYVWRARLPAAACPIGDGDFPGWLGRTGARAFTTVRRQGSLAIARNSH